MLRLFVKDNYSGRVHEYGTDQHDALILMDDGSLHYEHLQCGVGTMFPEEGFSFCNEDGSIPALAEDVPYIDIGGEFYKKPQTNADRIRAMTDEELAKEMLFFCPTDTVFKGEDTYGKPHYTGLDGGYYATSEKVVVSNLEWLKQPVE